MGRDVLRRVCIASEPRKIVSTKPPRIRSVGEQVGVLNKIEYSLASDLAGRLIERYTNAEIDSVYVVFNEFKSVIAQRLVVEQLLPIERIGAQEIAQSREMQLEEKQRVLEAAKGAG